MLEWLSFLGSDVHKSFGRLFKPGVERRGQGGARDTVGKKFDYVDGKLDGPIT